MKKVTVSFIPPVCDIESNPSPELRYEEWDIKVEKGEVLILGNSQRISISYQTFYDIYNDIIKDIFQGVINGNPFFSSEPQNTKQSSRRENKIAEMREEQRLREEQSKFKG